MIMHPPSRAPKKIRSGLKSMTSSPQNPTQQNVNPENYKYFQHHPHQISKAPPSRYQSLMTRSVAQIKHSVQVMPQEPMTKIKLLDSHQKHDVSTKEFNLNIKQWGIIGGFTDSVLENDKELQSMSSCEKFNRATMKKSFQFEKYDRKNSNTPERSIELFQSDISNMIGRGSKEILQTQLAFSGNKLRSNLQRIKLKGQSNFNLMKDKIKMSHPTYSKCEDLDSPRENQRYFDKLLTSHNMIGVEQMIINDKEKINGINMKNSTSYFQSPTPSIRKRIQDLRSSAPVSPQRRLLRKPNVIQSLNNSNQFTFDDDQKNATIDDSDSFIEQNKLALEFVKHTSKNDYNKVFKQFKKLQNYSELYEQKQNIYIKMISTQQTNNTLPKKLQIIQNIDMIGKVNASHTLSSKSSNKVFSSGLDSPQSQSIKSINLGHNYLKQIDVQTIIQSMPASIQNLDLKGNHLNSSSMIIICQFLKSSQIKNLNLEQNNFGDQGCCILLNSIQENRNLSILNLSKNQLTSFCCDSLGRVLKKNTYLFELYLHYNNINQCGGAIIFKSLQKNTSLKVLDISFNSMGNQTNFAQRTGTFLPISLTSKHKNQVQSSDCCQAIIKILSKSIDLVHLDLSHNSFSNEEAQEIARAIQTNQTLYGFHFEGNDQKYILDVRGYLRLVDEPVRKDIIQIASLTLKSQSIELDEITKQEDIIKKKQQDTISIKMRDDTESIKQQHRLRRIDGVSPRYNNWQYRNQKYLDTCWICEGWQEVLFIWTPGVSGELAMEPLFIHVNINDYKPILMNFDQDKFFLHMMCPPRTRIQYFFSNPIMGIETVAKEQLIHELDEEDEIDTKFLDLLYNGRVLVKTQQIKQMNYLFCQQNLKVIDEQKYYTPTVVSKPRQETMEFDFTPFIDNFVPQWCLEASIFNNYSADSQQLINECFEFDFNSSKIARLVKDVEFEQVKETLRQLYPLLFHSYKFYASSSALASLPCLSILSLNEFISQTNIMDGKIRGTDIEVSFISCNGKDIKYPQVNERALVRYQFMEILVRIAQDKYFKLRFDDIKEMEFMFEEDQIVKWLQQFDSSQLWRYERLWNEKCDIVLRKRLPFLKILFKYTCKINPKNKYYKHLWASAKDFRDMLNQASLIHDNFSERDCNLAFLLGMMTQVDELFTPRHYQMNFYEFLEGIARVSEKISLMVPQGIDGQNVYDMEGRREISLDEKLDALILYLYYRLGEFLRKEFQTQTDDDLQEMDVCILGTKKVKKIKKQRNTINLKKINLVQPPQFTSPSSESDESFQDEEPNTMDMQTQEFQMMNQLKTIPNTFTPRSQQSQQTIQSIAKKRLTIKGVFKRSSLASTFSLVSVVAYLRQKQHLKSQISQVESNQISQYF